MHPQDQDAYGNMSAVKTAVCEVLTAHSDVLDRRHVQHPVEQERATSSRYREMGQGHLAASHAQLGQE